MATLATLSIPLTTINGTQTFGPALIPQGVTWARLAIDRTAGGQSLNSQPSAEIDLLIEVSLDGTTWQAEISAHAVGGLVFVRGVQQNTSFIEVNPIEGDPASTTRQARATVSTNASVSVAGNLTLGS